MPVALRRAHLDRGCGALQPRFTRFLFFYLKRNNEGLSGNNGSAAGAAELAWHLTTPSALHATRERPLPLRATREHTAHPGGCGRSRPSGVAITITQELPFLRTHSVSGALHTLFYS